MNAHTHDTPYLDLCSHILSNGVKKEDRTGTGTLSVFGHQMRFDLAKGFPLLTTKKIPFRLVAEELLWFLAGDTNVRTLAEKNVNIWNPDAYRWHRSHGGTMKEAEFNAWITENDFDLGPIYGAQWRSWGNPTKWEHVRLGAIDQISNVIEQIKTNPDSRRLIVSAWNPSDLDNMALPPCHVMFQFYVADGKLSCQLYQRSGDVFLGVPFNIASYALLTKMIAIECGLELGEFVHTLGDAHIYLNHIEQAKEQLSREPKPAPEVLLVEKDSIFDYTWDDIILQNYDPHPAIKGEVSVGQ